MTYALNTGKKAGRVGSLKIKGETESLKQFEGEILTMIPPKNEL